MLAEKLLAGRVEAASAFNFGPGAEEEWSVEKIANRLVDLWGSGASWVSDSAPSVHEARYLKLDSTKARSELGWQQRLNLESTLEWTLRWYRQWHANGDLAVETLAQITAYEQLHS